MPKVLRHGRQARADNIWRFMPISPCLFSPFPILPLKNIHFAFSYFAFSNFASSQSALFYLAFVFFRLFIFRLMLFCLCFILPYHKLPYPFLPSSQFAIVLICLLLFHLVLIYLCPNSPSSYLALSAPPLYYFAFFPFRLLPTLQQTWCLYPCLLSQSFI